MSPYVVELQDLPTWNANSRGHWSERASIVAAWRMVARVAALRAEWPHMDRCEVELMMVPKDRRRRDPDNLAGALKPCIDGIVDAGVLSDDSADIVKSVTLRVADPNTSLRAHRWLLTIWDISDLEDVDAA